MTENQDFEPSQFRRRSSDFQHPASGGGGGGGGGPSNKDLMDAIVSLQGDVRDIKHNMGSIRTAFIRNDLGDPDYDGHRISHLKMVEADKRLEGMKTAGALKFAGAVGLVLGTIFLSGIGPALQKLLAGG